MLHITNGDAAGDGLRAAGLPGEVLPWRDVLHEGPVPAGLSLEELRSVRARFLADRGAGEFDAVLAGLARRDAALERAGEQVEVVLWFEHDLYDQLQLLQLLEHFAAHPARELSLICIDRHPGVERFLGLGQLSPGQLAELFDTRRPVTDAQLELGRRAWAAFRAEDPTQLEALLGRDTSALPFLRAALRRHLEEFPSTRNGLGRTQRQILALVASGVHGPTRLFQAHQEMEEAPFLGDWSFWHHLRELLGGKEPLLRRADHAAPLQLPPAVGTEPVLVLTERGREAREGRADWPRLCGGLDRWLGGVHLRGPEPAWRWDMEAEGLTRAG